MSIKLDMPSIRQLAEDEGVAEKEVRSVLQASLLQAYSKFPDARPIARVEVDERGNLTIWGKESEEEEEADCTPEDFNRQSTEFVRSALRQLVHHMEDEKLFGSFLNRRGQLITGTVQQDEKDEDNKPLPVIKEGDVLFCRDIKGNQHFTQPPARYNEATLIKAMEESGIGRPSTYAATVSTILSREYVEREGKTLKPTNLGEVITGLMKEQFPEIVDLDFTANMEQQLDGVESGKADWVKTLDDFYTGFAKTLKKAEENIAEYGVGEYIETRLVFSCLEKEE